MGQRCRAYLDKVENEFDGCETEKTAEIKDCITCSNNDADMCRSCVSKAVRAGEYPLWEAKAKLVNSTDPFYMISRSRQ